MKTLINSMKVALGLFIVVALLISYWNTYSSVVEGLKDYDSGKVHSAIIEKYGNLDELAKTSSELWFLNYLYYIVLKNVPYNEERAGDVSVFLKRGGDCFDFTYFIIGLYHYYYPNERIFVMRMNLLDENGERVGHVVPIIHANNNFCIVDKPMGIFVCGKRKSDAIKAYENALKKEGFVIEKKEVILVFDDVSSW